MEWRRWTVAGWGAAVAALLLVPLPTGMEPAEAWRAVGQAGHAALFFGLARLAVRAGAGRLRTLLGTAMIAGGMECLQLWTGRSCEWEDWLFGFMGAGMGCLRGGRWPVWPSWSGLFVLAILPMAWVGVRWGMEIRAFPVLASGSEAWASRGWTARGMRLAGSRDGFLRMEPDGGVGVGEGYPGLFRRPAVADWSGGGEMVARIYWSGPDGAVLALRIDDGPGNPSYAERFQREFSVSNGWNEIGLAPEEWRTAGGGRRLDDKSIRVWGLFLVSPSHFDYLLLDTVRLEME